MFVTFSKSKAKCPSGTLIGGLLFVLATSPSAFGLIKGYRMSGCGDKNAVEARMIEKVTSTTDLCGASRTAVHTGGTTCRTDSKAKCPGGGGLVCMTQFSCVDAGAPAPLATSTGVSNPTGDVSAPAARVAPALDAVAPSPSRSANPNSAPTSMPAPPPTLAPIFAPSSTPTPLSSPAFAPPGATPRPTSAGQTGSVPTPRGTSAPPSIPTPTSSLVPR